MAEQEASSDAKLEISVTIGRNRYQIRKRLSGTVVSSFLTPQELVGIELDSMVDDVKAKMAGV